MTSTIQPGKPFTSISPATGEVAWRGLSATHEQVIDAVFTATSTWQSWHRTPLEQRLKIARQFAQVATRRQAEMATLISAETGKPLWESTSEAKLIPAKVESAIAAYQARCVESQIELPQGIGRVHWTSLGVMVVLGPFNFPAHLPNGHLVPSLIAGNVAIFKPSEWTPGCGDLLAEFWREAGLPDGVLQVLQGDRVIGSELVNAKIDGVLFTGSYAGGSAIHRQLGGRPEVLLALEMGGNTPLIVDEISDIEAAAVLCIVSAYITAGQRCTCARRLILPDGPHVEPLLERIRIRSESMIIGVPNQKPEPFMGPLISRAAGQRVMAAQQALLDGGGVPLLACESRADNPAFVTPGLMDVTHCSTRHDEEVFGPFLQVIRVANFDEAVSEANATDYGLAAALVSENPEKLQMLQDQIRAGIVNWNQPTIGASGQLPFGGLGKSGNFRPSGFAAAEYCSTTSAGIESPTWSPAATGYPGLG